MSSFFDSPMIYRSRHSQSILPADYCGSLLLKCVDVPELTRSVYFRGMEVIATALIPEIEPKRTMVLKLDSRHDVTVCVQKAFAPVYEVDGRWYTNPKNYERIRRMVEQLSK